jgi:hypothetical protein
MPQGEEAMSAFVVEDKTINVVVSWMHEQRPETVYHRKIKEAFGLDLLSPDDYYTLSREMFKLNCTAVRQRYADNNPEEMIPDGFTPSYELAQPVQAYKSLRCWLYQCCEGETPEASILYNIMTELSNEMAGEIVTGSPQYEQAAWG